MTWPDSFPRYRPHKFCSIRCYRAYLKVSENAINWKGGKVKKICTYCGKEYFTKIYLTEKSIHCGMLCHNRGIMEKKRGIPLSESARKKISGENSPHWRGGRSNSPWSYEFNLELKQAVRDRDGNKCRRCGKEQGYSDGRKLAIHHINFDKNDNRLENLAAVCASCHSKITRNPQLWEGCSPIKFTQEVAL